MKKFVSTLMASVLAVSAFPIVSASAVETPNTLSVSTEILGESVTVDETVIPEGSVAVTVSVSNNRGFDASMTKLKLGKAYDVITNEKGIPVCDLGEAATNSLIAGSENNNVVAFSMACSDTNTSDGNLFTFYASADDSESLDITVIDSEYSSRSSRGKATKSILSGYYKIGDVDNDSYVSAADASDVLHAIGLNGKKLSVSVANQNLPYYFPSDKNIVCAESGDPDLSGTLTEADANDILLCYSCLSTGQDYKDFSDGHCLEIYYHK